MLTSVRPTHILARITAALLGGYGFTWGCAALSVSGMTAFGMSYEQAHTATMLVAFLIFLCAFLWSFVDTNIVRVWSVLAGGGALMTGLAWWLQRLLIG